MKRLFKQYPFFTWLLPVFFVLHGFVGNYGFVKPLDALVLLGIYFIATAILLLLFKFLYRNWKKAAVMTFALMCCHFFFGSLQDFLRYQFPNSWPGRYSFLLPLMAVVLFVVAFQLKKKKPLNEKWTLYLNFIFTLFLAADFVTLAWKNMEAEKQTGTLPSAFAACDTCTKPDIYIIICDEYAGQTELQELLSFDNSEFLDTLRQQGFHIIPHSTSNYNYTPYSIASFLNMDYLPAASKDQRSLLATTYETIRRNNFLLYLERLGYDFYNYSYFDMGGQPTLTRESFLPANTKLITGQTFLSRIEKEMRYHLVTTFKSKAEIRKNTYRTKNDNDKLYNLTLTVASQRQAKPKFVLTHLMLPHYPYYFDRNGNEFPYEQLQEGNQYRSKNYIEYLQYANKKILALTGHILGSSVTPPVIIVMSDHGFRHFENKAIDPRYYFYNLSAVHLPGTDYSAYNDSLTNVNLLRATVNTIFGQQLPLLRDTTFVMDNP